jgi:integrase
MPEREVLKIAADKLRPVNQGLLTAGSAVNFMHFVTDTYEKTALPLLASTVQSSYRGAIAKHLEPAFGDFLLRDLTPATLQGYFSGLPRQGVAHPTIVKLRDALSSILRCAVEYEFLSKNPIEGLRLPPDKRGEIAKPWLSPAECNALVGLIPEPYATMVCVAVFAGLRVSELAGLRWRCVFPDSIQVGQRFTRGDWSCPKTQASGKPIAVEPWLIERIHRLKDLTVAVHAGRATRHYRVVKSARPDDLVFQSVKDGKPVNDQNILKRYIQPAAARLGLRVHWRALRTSYGTWNVAAGSDVKSVQAQMRHAKPETTLSIYAQFVPENQRRAARQLGDYVRQRIAHNPGPIAGPLPVQ